MTEAVVKSFLPPLWAYGAVLAFVLVVNFTIGGISFFSQIPIEAFEISLFPLSEEALKFWFVARLAERAVGAIVAFGLIELTLKFSSVLSLWGTAEFPIIAVLTLAAFVFNLATAFSYETARRAGQVQLVFASCVVLHILYNTLPELGLSLPALLLGDLIIIAMVVAIGAMLRLRRTPPARRTE